MLTEKFLGVLHGDTLEVAMKRIRTVAEASCEDVEARTAEYLVLRRKHELPTLVGRCAGVIGPKGSDLVAVLEAGAVATVELVDGEAVLKLALPGSAPVVSPAVRKLGQKARWCYSDANGVIRCVADWLRTKHPDSPATRELARVDAAHALWLEDKRNNVPEDQRRGSGSKKGAPDILADEDPELNKLVSRTRIG
jgi:hypothetical protein